MKNRKSIVALAAGAEHLKIEFPLKTHCQGKERLREISFTAHYRHKL